MTGRGIPLPQSYWELSLIAAPLRLHLKFQKRFYNSQTEADLLPPEVPETAMSPDLLQPLQIFSQLVVQTVSEDLKQDVETSAVISQPQETSSIKTKTRSLKYQPVADLILHGYDCVEAKLIQSRSLRCIYSWKVATFN